MKPVLIIFISLLAAACTKEKAPEPSVVPAGSRAWDNIVMLDAEELAEGSFVDIYDKMVVPALKKYVPEPAKVVEDLDADKGVYKVNALGTWYVIFAYFDDDQSNANATIAMFDIVNRQLESTPYKFYAIGGGNDLGGVFLTKEGYDRLVKTTPRKNDWPYIPQPEKP